MFFELNTKTYGVKFTRVGNRTFAELMEVNIKGHLSHTNIYGEVGLFYKDVFDGKTGRKFALALLLNKMQKKFKLDKTKREEIWNIYFQKNGK